MFLSELLRMKMFNSLFILDLSAFLMSFPKITGLDADGRIKKPGWITEFSEKSKLPINK